MSTPCRIAIKTENGYKAIYCHHDGYPEYMWEMLTTNYNTEELATKLVNLGDASAIYEKLEPTTATHSFDNPERGVCIFYGRDRGETDAEPEFYPTPKALLSTYFYVYIFDDGRWYLFDGGKEK